MINGNWTDRVCLVGGHLGLVAGKWVAIVIVIVIVIATRFVNGGR